jgi:hypothetical protein
MKKAVLMMEFNVIVQPEQRVNDKQVRIFTRHPEYRNIICFMLAMYFVLPSGVERRRHSSQAHRNYMWARVLGNYQV